MLGLESGRRWNFGEVGETFGRGWSVWEGVEHLGRGQGEEHCYRHTMCEAPCDSKSGV